MNNGIRLKIDVTPAWWKSQVEDPDVFEQWCVKAVRLILGTWPRAEIRLSREKVCAVVSFDGETRAGLVHADKVQLREALDGIGEEPTSPLGCEHANESPRICQCPPNCYCQQPGNTCGSRKQ